MALSLGKLKKDKNKKSTSKGGVKSSTSKKTEEKKVTREEKKKSTKKLSKTDAKKTPVGPYPVSFYNHEVRRYYKEKVWYFSIDDISRIADKNPDLPHPHKGDQEKLKKAIKKHGTKIEGVVVARPVDIAKFIPSFKGSMPGPIVSWLIRSDTLPGPKFEDFKPTIQNAQDSSLPQDIQPLVTLN